MSCVQIPLPKIMSEIICVKLSNQREYDANGKPTVIHVQSHKAELYLQFYRISALCTKDKMSCDCITVRDNFLI